MMQPTDKQQEIKRLLDTGLTAREVGDAMGVTRNSIYQQIARMRKNGLLASDYTPTGQPVRETFGGGRRPGEDVIRLLTEPQGDVSDMSFDDAQRAGMIAIAQELRNTRDELDAIVRRLSNFI